MDHCHSHVKNCHDLSQDCKMLLQVIEYGVVVYSPFTALKELNIRIIHMIGDSSLRSELTNLVQGKREEVVLRKRVTN